MEAQLREEILVREAIALGLDQGDAIIRNRLAQKMTFLTTSVAQSMLPEDEILIAMLLEAALEDAGCVVVGPYGRLSEALEAARAAKAQRFVFASSVYVYSESGSFSRGRRQLHRRWRRS